MSALSKICVRRFSVQVNIDHDVKIDQYQTSHIPIVTSPHTESRILSLLLTDSKNTVSVLDSDLQLSDSDTDDSDTEDSETEDSDTEDSDTDTSDTDTDLWELSLGVTL